MDDYRCPGAAWLSRSDDDVKKEDKKGRQKKRIVWCSRSWVDGVIVKTSYDVVHVDEKWFKLKEVNKTTRGKK